jgi:hypothetical protein
MLALLLVGPATSQHDFDDEPLLATRISTADVTIRARYIRQWRDDAGTWVLLANGGFRLELEQRRLSATNAVVWIDRAVDPRTQREYFDLTVYLSENAEVREAGGTVTLDNVLLVRNLRTSGRIIKEHDLHAIEELAASPLYQEALAARSASRRPPAPDEPPSPVVTRPGAAPTEPEPPRVIRYRLPRVEPAVTPAGDTAYVASGGVYFSQAGGPDAAVLEIRADNAVVFTAPGAGSIVREQMEAAPEPAPEPAPPSTAGNPPTPIDAAPPPSPRGIPPAPPAMEDPVAPEPPERGGLMPGADTALGLGGSGMGGRVRAVYLEGDVVLSMGDRFIRASRLYYDFERERALILDAVLRADMPDRGVPLYIRAEEIRQLSAREFSADEALVTTSEFYTPSYHVGASRVVLRDLTTRDESGRSVGAVSGTYEMDNATLSVEGWPVLWWPHSKGRFSTSETLLRSLRAGYDGDNGAEIETSWFLLNMLGVDPPPGYDATLHLDYFSRRGPATGIDVDYDRDDHYGLVRTYYLHDDGEDNLGLLRRRQEPPTTPERGRVLWRHRHYLPYDWEATVELSYISDPNFLEEWRESEFHEGKEQETLVYLKRARETEAITILANWRILDFLTQTEHLPDVTYRRIGDTFLSPLVLYHESRIGGVRYLRDDRWFLDERRFNNDGDTDVVFRGDIREEAELPLKLGALNVVPFASVRGTYWSDQPLDSGGLWRGLGVYGIRGGTSFSRVFENVESELLDIHRLRHVIKPDFAAWWGHSNTRSELITPFDYGVETIDDFYGVTFGLRQLLQTKRGPVEDRRTVDLLEANVEVGLFGDVHGRNDYSNGYADPLRPENSRTRNYLAGDLIYRLSDTTSLLYDFNIDLNDFAYDRHNVSLAVERNPRLAYVFGARYAGDIDMSLVGGGWNYRLNEKHITTVRAWYDVERGDLGEIRVGYVRRLPRWWLGLNFEYDRIDDDFSITLSLWPEGIPEWALGSRRYTDLARSTRIRAE